MSRIEITIESVGQEKLFVARVYSDICVGEFIRNCCVNLGIDPDTINGITVNVRINFNETINWQYNPSLSLKDAGFSDGKCIQIESIDK